MSATAFAPVVEIDAATAHAAIREAEAGYFGRRIGTTLEQLLAPINNDTPAGQPVRGTMLFRMVEQARLSDDATLPMGAWVVDLKNANWPKVSALIVGILVDTSKDLLLASWLLEAEIQQRSFAAVAPGIALMHGLCLSCWDQLHPQGEGGDFEARTNIVRWVNDKLLRTLSLVPLVTHEQQAFSWSDWEVAHHNARILATKGELPEEAATAPMLIDLHLVMVQVSLEVLRERYAEIEAARLAIAAFEVDLRERLGGEAASLGKLADFLVKVQGPIRGEIVRRSEAVVKPVLGLGGAASLVGGDGLADDDLALQNHVDGDVDAFAEGELPVQSDRERAYETLGNVADYLAHVEPHSPVPYLLRRAMVWGEMNTAELYQELFQRSGGQIGIFDLLGLEVGGG